jgi:hypothetical protein
MNFSRKTFRIFISSTFDDFKVERDLLQNEVFPRLEAYCQRYGFQFQPIDLRWGVSEEAQLDQQTLEVCLQEVDICNHHPHPNFLILLGDRYGWVPLPYEITEKEFLSLLAFYAPQSEEHTLLTTWYKLDRNHLTQNTTHPHAYFLKSRYGSTYKDASVWVAIESRLRTALQNAAMGTNLCNEGRAKFFLSATEHEARIGLFSENSQHTFAFIRQSKLATSHEEVRSFCQKIQNHLPPQNIINATINYEDTTYLKSFAETVEKVLLNSIDHQINNFKTFDVLTLEQMEHEYFLQERINVFIGRHDVLEKIANYAVQPNGSILLIAGTSGIGKSAVMAKAVQNIINDQGASRVVYRFIGASVNSTNIRMLLISIINEMKEKGIVNFSEPYKHESWEFFEQIQNLLAKIERSVSIFIDALDQLSTPDNMQWLPNILPQNVAIIISVLNDDSYLEDSRYFTLLAPHLESANTLHILPFGYLDDTKQLLDTLLQDAGRTLQPMQKAYVLERFALDGSMLYMKVALELVKHWHSDEETVTLFLSDTITGLIHQWIDTLSSRHHHTKEIVVKTLGLVHASQYGLSEKELLDLLSLDKKVLNAIEHDDHVLPRNQIGHKFPVSIWARLHFTLRPFLVERYIDNQSLINFFHRQINTVVERLYYYSAEIKIHTTLSDYFTSLIKINKTWDEKYPLRVLSEMAYHQLKGSMSKNLYLTFTNLEFWGAIYDANKQDGVHKILDDAMRSILYGKAEELKIWSSFFREKAHQIRSYDRWKAHQSLFQLAYMDGEDSPLTKKAVELEPTIKFPWIKSEFRWKNFRRNHLLATIHHSDTISGVLKLNDVLISWSSDNTVRFCNNNLKEYLRITGYNILGLVGLHDERILTWSRNTTLRIWSLAGEKLVVLEKHSSFINGAIELSDGKILSWSKDGSLIIWSATGEFICVLDGHSKDVLNAIELSDGKILSWSYDNTIRLWDKNGEQLATFAISNGSELNVTPLTSKHLLLWESFFKKTFHILQLPDGDFIDFVGHTKAIKGAIELSDSRILSWSYDETLRIWDLQGKELVILNKYTKRVCGAIELSDRRILSWSENGSLIMWSNVGEFIWAFDGYSKIVNAIELSNKKILAYLKNGTLIVLNNVGKMTSVLEGHNSSVGGVIELSDGNIITWTKSYLETYIKLWDVKNITKRTISDGHQDVITKVRMLNNEQIISASEDKTIRVWNKNGTEKVILNHNKPYVDFQILSLNKILSWSHAYNSDSINVGSLLLWNSNGEKLAELHGHHLPVQGALALSDGRVLSWSTDKTLRIWDSQGKELAILNNHTKRVDGAIELSDRKILSWSSTPQDTTIRIWNYEGKYIKGLRGHTGSIEGVIELTNGKILSWSDDSTLRIWSTTGEKIILKGHQDGINEAHLLKNNNILSSSLDDTLRLWDSNGVPLALIDGQFGLELPNGNILSYSNRDNLYKTWTQRGDLVSTMESCNNFIKNVKIVNGKLLSWSYNNSIMSWELDGTLNIFYFSNDGFEIHDILEKTIIASYNNNFLFTCSLENI